MRIVVAHNAYRHQGGEDAVVAAEVDLLRRNGNEVRVLMRSNLAIDGGGALALAAGAFWSRQSAGELAALVHEFRPDVLHVHNTLPLLSPSIYWTADRLGVATVQTLHNFRLLCPQAMFLRAGRVCEDCLGKLPWRAVAHRCYRDSRLQSAVVGGVVTGHRFLGTWSSRITRYIALSRFARDRFVAGGIPLQRLSVKPNFVEDPTPSPTQREGGLFVGRLSPEKGIAVLLDALALPGAPRVTVVGDGPCGDDVARQPLAIARGRLDVPQVQRAMSKASWLVVPSICFENFPRTIAEAFACSLPVIVSRLGSLAEIVADGRTGLHFDAGDSVDLHRKMRWAQDHPDEMARMGQEARREYESRYTPQRNYELLKEIYEQAVAERSSG